MRFPRLTAADYAIFAGARVTMPRMPVLEKAKILAAAQKAFEGGLIGYGEARSEAGHSTDDLESVIEEWKEARELLGIVPEPPADGDEPEEDEPDDDDDKRAEDEDKA